MAPDLLAWVAKNVDYWAIFVKRGASAPGGGGSTRNGFYFIACQLAGAHAIEYSVLLALLHHVLLLSSRKMVFSLTLLLN
jgi:hypothetical protein